MAEEWQTYCLRKVMSSCPTTFGTSHTSISNTWYCAWKNTIIIYISINCFITCATTYCVRVLICWFLKCQIFWEKMSTQKKEMFPWTKMITVYILIIEWQLYWVVWSCIEYVCYTLHYREKLKQRVFLKKLVNGRYYILDSLHIYQPLPKSWKAKDTKLQ